jgi:hypothetical protein
MSFDGLKYTREALAEELALIERHATDGSALDAGCSCIQEKHLLMIAGLAREGKTLATDQQEKDFYDKTAQAARELRKTIVDGDFIWPTNPLGGRWEDLTPEEREQMTRKIKWSEKAKGTNPSPQYHKVLSRCINKVEHKCCEGHAAIVYDEEGHADYSNCSCNPFAVCKASVKTNPHPRLSKEEFAKQMELFRETAETKHPTVKYHATEYAPRELR